jgi:glutamate decarboxylase
MIDRLITDVVAVTETLMKSGVFTTSKHKLRVHKTLTFKTDKFDLQAWQPTPSIERTHASHGLEHKDRHKARAPMDQGVHRSVC